MRKTITYPKGLNGKMQRALKEAVLLKQGWQVVEEKEVKKYSGGKGLLLGLLFLPLALLGGKKYIEVTYERTAA